VSLIARCRLLAQGAAKSSRAPRRSAAGAWIIASPDAALTPRRRWKRSHPGSV